MTDDGENKILSTLNRMERRVMDEVGGVKAEVAELKGVVIRVESSVKAQEEKCVIRHEGVDAGFGSMRARVAKLENHEEQTGKVHVANLEAEIKRRDEARRKLAFWVVTAILGGVGGGGGLTVLIRHLLGM